MKSNKSKISCKWGFTLIELLVVVLIIGILAAVAVPQYQKAVDKSRVSELFAIVKNIKMQQEVFYLEHGYYAANCEELGADLPAGFAESSENSGRYALQKGNYELVLRCRNGNQSRVLGAINADPLFVNIYMYFDHTEEDEGSLTAGRSVCQSADSGSRSMNVCKSLGKEERDSKSYWL